MNEEDLSSPTKIPITGTLDLHGFQPKEVKELVLEYLIACEQEGIYQGRIIHGKGIGTLRELVHSIFKKHPKIKSFSLGSSTSGDWGSTSFSLFEKD